MIAVSRFIVHVEPLRPGLSNALRQMDEMLGMGQDALPEEACALRDSLMVLMVEINGMLVDLFLESMKDLAAQEVWLYAPEIAETEADAVFRMPSGMRSTTRSHFANQRVREPASVARRDLEPGCCVIVDGLSRTPEG